MCTVKDPRLGLMSKPYPVADLTILEPLDQTSRFKNRNPKVHTVTIERNKDFKELPF